jgi:hypothetical protein
MHARLDVPQAAPPTLACTLELFSCLDESKSRHEAAVSIHLTSVSKIQQEVGIPRLSTKTDCPNRPFQRHRADQPLRFKQPVMQQRG